MSRYTYAGPYKNPTEDFAVRTGHELLEFARIEALAREQPNPDLHNLRDDVLLNPELFYVCIPEPVNCDCPCSHCTAVLRTPYRVHSKHASGKLEGFEEESDAWEWIESLKEFFDDDYEQYCEENHHAIVQMELYEMHRNEY